VVYLIKHIVYSARPADMEAFAKWFESQLGALDKSLRYACASFKGLGLQARGQQFFLMGLMCTPRNELFFVQAAKALTPELCMVMVRSVAGLLLHYGLRPVEKREKRSRYPAVGAAAAKAKAAALPLAVPTFEQTLDLMSVTLDASFRKVLALDMTDAHTKQMLEAVLKIVQANGKTCSELSEMREPLDYSLRRSNLKPIKPASGYQVDKIYL